MCNNFSLILPFGDLNDDELVSVFSDVYYNLDLYNDSYYFDPNCLTDSHNRITDPDFGFSSNNDINFNSMYHELDDMTNLFQNLKSNSAPLKIVSQNIRSMPKNFEEFYLDIRNLNFDIIALNETWLSEEMAEIYTNLPGYNSVFKNRNTYGGGVLFFIRKNISFEKIEDLCISDSNMECIFLKIELENELFIVGNIYRPPSGKMNIFNEKMQNILDYWTSNYANHKIYILGDLNANILNSFNSIPIQNFTNLLFSFGLNPVIRRPTRVSNFSATILDQIWTSDTSGCISSGIIRTRITDHFTIFACASVDVFNRNDCTTEYKTYRNFSRLNKAKFKELLSGLSWQNLLEINETELAYKEFYKLVLDLYNHCFPICKRKVKPIDEEKPYIAEGIIELIREKRRILKLYNKRPITYKNSYHEIRNRVSNAVRSARNAYYHSNFEQSERNPRKIWEIINEILGRKNEQKLSIKNLETSSGIVSSGQDIANGLNDFFSNIGQDLNNNVPPTDVHFSHFMQTFPNCEFTFTPVTEEEVIKTVTSLNNTGAGYDEIPMFIYKNYIGKFAKVITHISNLSLRQGIFPSDLSVARVTCIYKSGSKSDPANYRPISILPSFSKILEKLVITRLYSYLSRNDMLVGNQFGFRRGKGTEDAIHSMVKFIHQSFNASEFVLGVFLDVKKAFDSLDREILLEKLKFYGIGGNSWKWFESYLTNRKQLTSYQNFLSDTAPVNFGVPQGGIVSGLLFLIYVNDVVNSSSSTNSILYADDTSLYFNSPNINVLFDKANQSLVNYKKWFDSNKLTLNTSKTQYIIFHRKQRRIPENDNQIFLGTDLVTEKKYVKFLGVVVDCNLSWNYHIGNLNRKLAKYVPIFYRIRNFCTSKALKIMYNGLVYSNLIYCNSIWGYCTDTALNPLTVLHKKVIRAMAGVNRLHSTKELFSRFSLLSLPEINVYMVGIFMYKCVKDGRNDWFEEAELLVSTRSASQNLIVIPRISNKHSEQCISYRGPKIWNDICLSTRNKSYDCFKKTFKTSLLSRMQLDF